jgi:hypothetical protein
MRTFLPPTAAPHGHGRFLILYQIGFVLFGIEFSRKLFRTMDLTLIIPKNTEQSKSDLILKRTFLPLTAAPDGLFALPHAFLEPQGIASWTVFMSELSS